MNQFPCLIRSSTAGGEARYALGDALVDSYLAFVAGRSRPNTLRAVAHDLKTFFAVIGKDPVEVVAADIFDFVADQRGDRSVVRISDGESGLSARTIARRLSSISGLFAYLVARGDTPVRSNPVSRGLSTRRRGGRRRFERPEVDGPVRSRYVRAPGTTGHGLAGANGCHHLRVLLPERSSIASSAEMARATGAANQRSRDGPRRSRPSQGRRPRRSRPARRRCRD